VKANVQHHVRPIVMSFVCAFVYGTGLLSAAHGQSVHSESAAIKLRVLVHLPEGPTTLARALSSISEQIRLTVEAEPYLGPRRLILHVNDMTAASALNALAELNGYAWHESEAGHVIITRATTSPPKNLAEIPQAIRFALPRDFARYFGIGVPVDELAPFPDEKESQAFEPQRRHDYDGWAETRSRIRAKLVRLIQNQTDRLYSSLSVTDLEGTGVRYTNMTRDQQEALLVVLAWSPWIEIMNGTAFHLLYY
jgi:hypothetical protein